MMQLKVIDILAKTENFDRALKALTDACYTITT